MILEKKIEALERLWLCRLFDETVAEITRNKEVVCPVHLSVGQEAIAVGICAHKAEGDLVFSTHRCHAHYLASGGDPKALMAEILTRETGCSGGYGGSMHVTDPQVGFAVSSAIVAGTIPLAVGAALAMKLRKQGNISIAFFGDGATDEGVFYESINFATLHNLPVLFVCENNGFSTHMPGFLRQSNTRVHERVKGFNIVSEEVDGNNTVAIWERSAALIKKIRAGAGPALLECDTYRWLAHVGPTVDADIGHRRKRDIDAWQARCPIQALTRELQQKDAVGASEIESIRGQQQTMVEEALAEAKSAPIPKMLATEEGC